MPGSLTPTPRVSWMLSLGDAGVLADGSLLWLRAVTWAVILFVVTAAFFFASILMGSWVHLSSAGSYAVALLVPILGFVVYAQAVRFGERRRAVEVLITRRTVPDLLIGMGIGFGLIVLTLALLWALGLYSVQQSTWSHGFSSFVFDSYISAMLEELAFRAVLLRLLARAFGPMTGLVLSAALFGVAHLSHASVLAAFEVAFNGGLVMGLLYLVTGRLWMSVGMHVAWDFTEESLLGVNSKTGVLHSLPVLGKPDFLTGGSYGPDASILAAFVGVAFILAILKVASRRSAPVQPA